MGGGRGRGNSRCGGVVKIGELEQYVEREVIRNFDNKDMNRDVADFKDLVPTSENLSAVIEKRLRRDWDNSFGGASLDEDLRRIDSVLSILQDGQKLSVDANGRFDLDTAIAYAKALSQYDLFWYEEPGDPLDFELQATLRNYYKKPIAPG